MNPSTENKESETAGGFQDKAFLTGLVKRCQDGDHRAMEMIYKNYQSPLFNLAYRFARDQASAKDLLQDIFINVFNHVDKLRAPEAFSSWLYRIAMNTCISFARQTRKVNEVSLDEAEDVHYAEEAEQPMSRHLEEAIKALPSKQKAVFLFHDVQGFTHTEIAQMTKLSEGTSKSQLFKARMKIKDYLRSKTK